MKLSHYFLPLLLLMACGDKQQEQKKDNFDADIPVAVPNRVALAGAEEPDIVRFLNVQDAYAPSLSPDGVHVAYRTDLSGEPQIWVTETVRLSAPLQITYGNSVTFHQWRPDHNEVLYATDKEGNERMGYYLVSADGLYEKELLAPSDAFREFGDFNKDGSQFVYATTERNGTDYDIHVFDISTNTDKKIYEGSMGYYPISFSPDGNQVVIMESIAEDANNLFLLNIADAKLIPISSEGDRSQFSDIEWKLDGSSFFLRTNKDSEYLGVARYDLETAKLEYILQKDFDIEQILYDDKKNILHWVANDGGFSKHHILDLDNRSEITPPDWPAGVFNLKRAKHGETLLANVFGPKLPGDLWAGTVGSKEVNRVTRSNNAGLDLERMVQPVAHSFQARDGLTVHGLLYPVELMNKDTPLVLLVHGGPTAQARPTFSAVTQYLTAQGFAVFDLNFRGSTGYGKTYARENDKRKRESELYDLEDAVNYLSEKGLVNKDKVAVMGGSYGGYLTMAAMTRLPEVFSCGVAFVGVSNWITALEGASPALKASDRLEYGDIDDPEDRKFFESISPMTYIDQVKDPVMVLHGANDPRDPITESDRFVKGIRDNGGEVVYLRFPDEGHGIRKMDNRITAYVRVVEFLEKHLK
ncbi:S9 family peptidase [Sediminicola sp. 1XM1-17]|uniref:S9 family peptidase n=1 Tax=Sediminicola sp. 1XM1-17 TaxID=3127702 RepID=UPI003077861D